MYDVQRSNSSVEQACSTLVPGMVAELHVYRIMSCQLLCPYLEILGTFNRDFQNLQKPKEV